MIKSKRLRCAGHVARMKTRTAHRILVGKPEGQTTKRPRRRWKDYIKANLRETEWRGIGLIHLAQDRDWWWLLWKWIWTFGLHKMLGNSWAVERLVASREGLEFMELVGSHSFWNRERRSSESQFLLKLDWLSTIPWRRMYRGVGVESTYSYPRH
jgi:hypothetical protein